jgi:hypothetical protein
MRGLALGLDGGAAADFIALHNPHNPPQALQPLCFAPLQGTFMHDSL